MTTRVKTPDEIAAMRASGKLAAEILKTVTDQVTPGMSTLEVSKLAEKEIARRGTKSAFKGYEGFTEVMCVSVNDEIIHGIPKADHIIQAGDLVSCDFGVVVDGMHSDTAVTIIVGQPKSAKDIELVNVTKKALQRGISVIKAGVTIKVIGDEIQRVLEGAGLGIVREFVGHGVGHELHEEPGIPNFGHESSNFVLQAGMTIAIEPMAMLGEPHIMIMDDGWTVKTRDGSHAAHFEHTVLVTEDGYEILTA